MNNPICKHCDNPLSLKIMKIIETECWKCNSSMKVAIMHSPDDFIKGSSHPGPDLFDNEDIDFAKSKEVLIMPHHSKTADDTYLANTCGSCNAFVGGHYLFDYFCRAEENKIESTDFEVGYHCETCFMANEERKYNEKYGEN